MKDAQAGVGCLKNAATAAFASHKQTEKKTEKKTKTTKASDKKPKKKKKSDD